MFEDKELYLNEIKPGIFVIDENHESTGYLVVGEKKACLIDTMLGYHDYRKLVEELTDKPYVVVNTHGHPDHIYGNFYFDEAYINPADKPVTEASLTDTRFTEILNEIGAKMPPFKDIKGGDVIELGGRTLEIYDLPGHTPGGIVLLLKEDRILFAGDSINHFLWLQVPHALPLTQCAANIDKLLFLEEKADVILHGHARDFDDIALMHHVRDGILEIIDGKTENDVPYEGFWGTAMQHDYEINDGRHYQQPMHAIVYFPDRIK